MPIAVHMGLQDEPRGSQYFIESTARDNVDDFAVPPLITKVLQPFDDSDVEVKEIAAKLASGNNPDLVVMVHGFNNPYPAVLQTYTAAALAIDGGAKDCSR